MRVYRPGEVVLVDFPFTDAQGAKRRPALVLLDTGDEDIVVARMTSQSAQVPFDVNVADWQSAGLLLPSVIRLHKLATLEKNVVGRKLGSLTPRDWDKVRVTVKQLWVLP